MKSRLSLIVRVNVVLNKTVIVDSDWRFDNLCGSHLQSQSELYHVSWWYYTLVIDLIGQLRRVVIGRLSVKPWCYWLWRLVISDWCVSIRLLSQLNSRLFLVVFSKNNYNTDFVRRNTHSNTDYNSQTNSGPVTTATIPYIRGTSETTARILQPYNIRVAHKPIGQSQTGGQTGSSIQVHMLRLRLYVEYNIFLYTSGWKALVYYSISHN